LRIVLASLLAVGAATLLNTSGRAIDLGPVSDAYVARFEDNRVDAYMLQWASNGHFHWRISGPHTGLQSPMAVSWRPSGKIYVGNKPHGKQSFVSVFAAGASGDATPVAVIRGDHTGLNGITDVAVGPTGKLYVANSGANTVTVYAAGANGNIAPIAKVGGSHTGLEGVLGLTVDRFDTLYVVSNPFVVNNTGAAGGTKIGGVTVYAPGANGDVAPTARIAGSSTGLSDPQDIAVDVSGKMYVANYVDDSVLVFALGAHGNVAPIARIAGSHTRLSAPLRVALDAKGRLFVLIDAFTPQSEFKLLVFRANATGDVKPLRVIDSPGSGGGLDAH
jgi:6-phosphogluconolactonase (cycloisomerase 2 family)